MADFNASFKLQVEGDEEIKKKLQEAKEGLQDIEEGAKDATKPIDDVGESLKDLAKADASKALEDTDDALKNVKSSAGDAQSEVEDFNDAIDDTETKADASKSSLDGLDTSYSNVSTSASDAQTNIDNSVQALEGVDSGAQGASSGLDAVGTAFGDVSTSAVEADQNIRTASEGIEGIGTSTGQVTTALDGLGSAFDGAGTAGTSFNDVLSSTDTRARDFASGGLTPLNTVLGEVGGATQQASGGIQGFNTNMGVMTGFIGTAASGAIQFVGALNALHGAQIKVDATQAKLSTSAEAVVKAQAHLNELLASGTASTQEIEQATLDLTQATDKNNIAIERAGKAQDDLNLKYAKFATDVLPGLIQSITSTVAVASQLHDKFKGTETSGLINFFTEGETGAKGLASAMLTLGLAFASAWAAVELWKQLPSITGAWTKGFEGDLDGVIKNLEEYRDVIKANPLLEPVFGQRLDAHIAQLKLQRQGVDDNTNALRQYGPTLESGGALLDKFGESQDKSAIKAQQQTEILEGQKPVIQALIDDIQNFAKEHNLFGQTMEDTSQVTATLTSRFGEMRDATTNFGQSFFDARQNIEQAKGGIDGFVQGVEKQIEVSETLKVKMNEQNEAMAENISQTMELVGSEENALNAMRKLQQSYADHQVAIDQLNTSLNTSEGQMASFQNAVAAGDEAFLQWVQTTRDAAVEAETFKGHLEGMANSFGGLPQWVEPTIENLQAFIRANTEGGDAAKEFARISLESYRGLVSAAEPLFNDLKQAVQDVMEGKFIESKDIEGALINPIQAAFDKLPPLVAATLDETERAALTFSAEFANIGEQAGSAWANNLKAHVDMGETFDQALAAANQAAIDIIAPFVAEHPETAQMIQPLIDALQTGTPEGVRAALESLAGMQGPFQTQAQSMLQEWNTMTGQLGPSMKTGVEAGIADMTQVMKEGFQSIVEAINNMINQDIKQDPASVPEINANTNPANESIQLIGTTLDQMKNYLTENPLTITVSTEAASASLTELTGKIEAMAGKNVTITVDTGPAGIAIQGLQQQLDAMAGKNVTITVDTGPAGIAITGLQTQIDAVHGTNVLITVDTGPAGLAITGLQGQIDGVHGKEVSIVVDTGAAGIAITQIQQDIDQVHGTNVYITVDTSGAQAAIQQLQQQINSLQQSMGGIGGGYTPGYQSPYGSYQGAYGSPYGYAQGFGPAVVNRPTRMLVGEAGPEFVSVIPMKGRNKKNPPRSITAADGIGGGQFPGQLWQSDAEEEAYKRQVQAAMQQGSQQGSQQGTAAGIDQTAGRMGEAVQQGAQQGVQEGMAQGYQQAPSNTELFGTGSRFTWGGGAAGTQLGGGMGGGAQYPMAPSDTSLFGTGTRFTWRGGASGTSLGGAMGGGLGGGGMMPIPPNFWTGTGGGAGGGGGSLAGNRGLPGVYTGQVPASYGKPLGQLINGIAATILPGQGPIRQAALGMHERLKKDTMIQAHANERVDIGPGTDHPGKSSGIDQASLDKIISLLERQLTQATTYKVDFNVDGHKLSSVAAKNMGTAGYGDK